jgi:hypothetical protein
MTFLDVTISKGIKNVQFAIYRTSTATDIIIPDDSYHPREKNEQLLDITLVTC